MADYPPGPWTIWGDSKLPTAEGVDYETMKGLVDIDTTGELYGENDQTGEVYEG